MSWLRRQKITNLTLAAIAAALVVTVVLTSRSVTTTERESRSFNVLAAFREHEITRISVEKGDASFRLERAGGGDAGDPVWHLKQPYDEEADPFAIDRLLGTLQFASWVREIKPQEIDRAAFGLDAPVQVVEIQMGDITYRLRIGKEAATPPGSRYLEITGEGAPRKGVVIVSKSLLDELDVSADDFRGRYVMPYMSPVLDRIELEGLGGTRRLVRGSWNGFRLENGPRANRQALDRVLLQFARTAADAFIDPAAAEKALANAEKVVVTMTPKADKKLPKGRVEVGGKCPEGEGIVALRTEPDKIAGCVPASVLGGLSTTADMLVDRTLFWMRRDEVESVEIEDGDKKLALARRDDAFILTAPISGNVEAEVGNTRLDAILRATGKVVENPDLTALGLAKPHGKVTVRSAAAQESKVAVETITWSAPAKDGTVYARRDHDGVVLALGREASRALRADASLVRSRNVFDFPLDEVTRVDVEGPVRQTFTRESSGTIKLLVPEGFEADGALSIEAIDALRTLTADRWVADEDDGSFGFDSPALVARFTTKKGDAEPKEHVVVLGGPTTSGYYAKVQGEKGVFVAPRRVYEILTTLVLDRGLFLLDPSAAIRVTLTTPERSATLEKQGEQFVQSGGAEQLPPAAIQRIVDALATLRAEAAVSIGPERPEHGLSKPLLSVQIENEPAATSRTSIRWKIGSGDSFRGVSVHYARESRVNATYAVPRSSVQQIIDAL